MKICDVFENLILDDGRPMSVYEHSFDEIWNSKEVISIRCAMAEGRKVTGCEYCYRQEQLGLESERLHETIAWQKGWLNPRAETMEHIKADAKRDAYSLPNGPETIYLDLGNLCNLKCRSCNGLLSSRIERDPVHSAWTNALQGPSVARWNDGESVIAPRRVLGVAYEGLGEIDFDGVVPIAWTDGDAVIKMSTLGVEVHGLGMSFRVDIPLELQIELNGEPLFEGHIPSGTWQQKFDIQCDAQVLELRFRSADRVGIAELKLIQKGACAKKKGLTFTRFSTSEEWFRQDESLYEELLDRLPGLTNLNIIGGEPLINPEMLALMGRLVESGAAQRISLALTTNATVVPDAWCDLAKQFKSLTIAVSLDGYGADFEYIRFPGRWEIASQNLYRLRMLERAYVYVHTTIQAYNILGLTRLFDYCDTHGIPFRYHVLEWPRFLNAWTMPLSVRNLAAKRLRIYCLNCKNDQKENVLRLASALESGARTPDIKQLREFMLFTNDLDVTRGQAFALAHTELLDLIRESGVSWTSDTRFGRRQT